MTVTALLDLDGVLAEFDTPLFERCRDELGHAFDIEHPRDQRHRFLHDHLPSRAHRNEMRQLICTEGWFRNLPVMAGAQDGVDAMLRAGWSVWVVTKPLEENPHCWSEKAAWIAEHFPALRDRVIITPDKSLVHGTFLLDDAIKGRWVQAATWSPVVFDRPYNREGSPWASYALRWSWEQSLAELWPWADATVGPLR